MVDVSVCGLARQGISICRSNEDLEEICQIKVLAIAKVEAGKKLGWTGSAGV